MTIVWLLCLALFLGVYTPMLFTIPQVLAGPRAAGQWMGLQTSSEIWPEFPGDPHRRDRRSHR